MVTEIKNTMNHNKAFVNFRIREMQADLQNFRKLRTEARQIIRLKKHNSWEKFVQSIDVNSSNTVGLM